MIKMLSSGFFLGYIPFGSGTFGSLVGLIIYFFLLSGLNKAFYLIFVFFIFITGILICDYAEKEIFKIKDDSRIVLDEIIGILITFIPVITTDFINLTLGFILFRIFDILKPFPIKKLQVIQGGVGIVIDDFMAGVYAATCLYFLSIFKPF